MADQDQSPTEKTETPEASADLTNADLEEVVGGVDGESTHKDHKEPFFP